MRSRNAACAALCAAAVVSTAALSVGQNRGGDSAPTRPQAPARQAAEQKQPPAETWEIAHAEAEYSDVTKKGTAKNVVATNAADGSELRCDVYRWDDRKQVAVAEGNVLLKDDRLEALAPRAELYYAKNRKEVVLEGDLKILLKPRKRKDEGLSPAPVKVEGDKAKLQDDPSEEEARRTPVDITCRRVEYRYAKDKKYAKLSGDFVAVQKLKDVTRTLKADFAESFGNEERVLLHPPVSWTDTKGRTGKSDKPVDITTGEGAEVIKLKNGVLTFPVEDEEADKGKKPAPDPKNPPAKPAKQP
jgi:lipopolysaccharide assembly outer membrane protein LptD (OstA)